MLHPQKSTAEQAAAKLAGAHYENFPVLSVFLPRALRQDIASLYAYCRTVDDLGDEASGDRMTLLAAWEEDLGRVWTGVPAHPVLKLLQPTVERHRLERPPFLRLLEANRRDQRQKRYADWADLLDYCTYSANPVGRLYLTVLGCRDEELFSLADATCTALQLTNFWQDIARDAVQGRIYIPQQALARAGVSEADILAGRDTAASARLIADLVEFTEPFFRRGLALPPFLPRRYAAGVRLFTAGGMAVLRKVAAGRHTALSCRPRLSRAGKAGLFWQVILPRRRPAADRQAFAICARLTRSAAGNFRAAFATLPRRRRQAMYALYAFCRVVDDAVDLAPDPAAAAARLSRLRRELAACLAGRPADPLFVALAAARCEFPWRDSHLYAVLDGVEQDLRVTRYPDFAALQEYCWLVAAAVGLLILGICGARSEAAIRHAEDLGFAMQITNILRDVKEDLESGRIYLPQADMARFGVDEAQLHAGMAAPELRALLRYEAERAQVFFASGARLFAYVPYRSRLCLMALHAVYSAILAEIGKNEYDVLAGRIRLSGRQKSLITTRVWWRWLWGGK